MKYCQIKRLSSTKFKRLTGVNRRTYQLMVRLVKAKKAEHKKLGRPPELIVQDQVLLVLQYWREYRTYFHIGQDFGVAESTACRIVHKIENILIKSRLFSLLGKKKLLEPTGLKDLVIMDVMESPIEKPQRRQKAFYSGKQKSHTLKTQVIVESQTLKIICLAQGKGKTHDFRLLKASEVKFGKSLKVIADKGYQGITKIHGLSQTPVKKPRGGKLTSSQKQYNRELNRLRIVVEHVNRRLKIFKILSERYRNRHRRFGLRANLIAGIYNYELSVKS